MDFVRKRNVHLMQALNFLTDSKLQTKNKEKNQIIVRQRILREEGYI